MVDIGDAFADRSLGTHCEHGFLDITEIAVDVAECEHAAGIAQVQFDVDLLLNEQVLVVKIGHYFPSNR